MPYYDNLSEQDTQTLVQAISSARLGSYRRFFHTTTDLEALGMYRWNEDLSEALARLTDLIEVVLRNQFHRALSKRYGQHGTSASRDWYAYLELPARSRDAVRDITHIYRRGTWQLQVPIEPRTTLSLISPLDSGLAFWT